jgi:hypothetical protein
VDLAVVDKIILEEPEIHHQYLHHKEILGEQRQSQVDQLVEEVLVLLDHLLHQSLLVV